jgi:hypothetical protein
MQLRYAYRHRDFADESASAFAKCLWARQGGDTPVTPPLWAKTSPSLPYLGLEGDAGTCQVVNVSKHPVGIAVKVFDRSGGPVSTSQE